MGQVAKGSIIETPLACACARGYKKIVELLLLNGADINYLGSVSSNIAILLTKTYYELRVLSIGYNASTWICNYVWTKGDRQDTVKK